MTKKEIYAVLKGVADLVRKDETARSVNVLGFEVKISPTYPTPHLLCFETEGTANEHGMWVGTIKDAVDWLVQKK
jgi:hypothetical protein